MKKEVPSFVSIYLVGCTWLLYSLVFPLYSLVHYFIVALLSFFVGIVSNKIFPKKTIIVPQINTIAKTGNPKIDVMVEKGKDYIRQLEALNVKIPGEKISRQIDEMKLLSEQIFAYIAKHESNAHQIDKFMDYYFPTTIKLLNDYVEIDMQTMKTQNMQLSMQKIDGVLEQMVAMFAHQLNELYANKALDVKTDIDVLQQMLAQEGMNGESFKGGKQ